MILLSYVLFISKVYFWFFSWSLFINFVISTEEAKSQVSQVLLKNEKFAINLNYRSFSKAACFLRYGWSDTKIAG